MRRSPEPEDLPPDPYAEHPPPDPYAEHPPPDPYPYGEAAQLAGKDGLPSPRANSEEGPAEGSRASALDPSRPFTRAEARAAGLGEGELKGPRFRRLFHGVYVSADVVDSPRLRTEAALKHFTHPARASHASAARLYGAVVPDDPVEHITVFDPKHRRRPGGIKCYVAEAGRPKTIDGVPVSSPGELFVELAGNLPLVDLVVLGDSLVKRGRITPTQLVAHCRASGRVGAPAARAAAVFVRSGVDSPMESRLRMLLVLAGLPEPEVNRTIRDIEGVPVRRYDLSWPSIRLIIDYDGRHHAERVDQWESDLARREAIDDQKGRIVVITSSGVYREPDRTVERIWRIARERGLAGVPARPSQDWRRHFGR